MTALCQQALLNRLEPIFEPYSMMLASDIGEGDPRRMRCAKVWKEIQSGSEWIVDADLRDFFGSADHEKLLALVAQRVADSRVLRLIQGDAQSGKLRQKGSSFLASAGTPQVVWFRPCSVNILSDAI